MTYDSFDCEINYVGNEYVHLESHDGIVKMSDRNMSRLPAEHKEICRKYAEFHLKRIGRPYLYCDF